MQHRVGPIEFVERICTKSSGCVGRTASDSDCTMGSELERVLGLATNTGCILSFVSPRYLAAVVCSLVSAHFVRERAKHSENSVSQLHPEPCSSTTHLHARQHKECTHKRPTLSNLQSLIPACETQDGCTTLCNCRFVVSSYLIHRKDTKLVGSASSSSSSSSSSVASLSGDLDAADFIVVGKCFKSAATTALITSITLSNVPYTIIRLDDTAM